MAQNRTENNSHVRPATFLEGRGNLQQRKEKCVGATNDRYPKTKTGNDALQPHLVYENLEITPELKR